MHRSQLGSVLMAGAFVLIAAGAQALLLELGVEEIVQAGGADLSVDGYSVPCLADWNSDGLPDLIVGEGGGGFPGTVHLHLNVGAPGAPSYAGSSHLLAGGAELVVPGGGCMGAFPRAVFWNDDLLLDLIVGDANGRVTLFLNEGEPGAPSLGPGSLVEVGPPGVKLPVDVGIRATPLVLDWNADGRRDLVVGAYDGRLHLFLNAGTDTAPDFPAETFAQGIAGDLVVAGLRASPVVMDLDLDGRKDLLSGNTLGEILIYLNEGSDESPLFGDFTRLTAAGLPIDFEGTPRTRPFVCDWTGDGWLDLLIGLGDGRVHLYQGGATAAELLPAAVRLEAPWPNPANPAAMLGFSMAAAGPLRLTVHAVSGRRLATLAAGAFGAGRHELLWRGEDEAGRALPAGVYLLRLEAAGAVATQRLVLLR